MRKVREVLEQLAMAIFLLIYTLSQTLILLSPVIVIALIIYLIYKG